MTEANLKSLLDIFADKDLPDNMKWKSISSLVWMGASQQMNITQLCENNAFYYIAEGDGPGPGFMYEEIVNVENPLFGTEKLVSFIPLDKVENVGFYIDKNESMFSKLKDASLANLVVPVSFDFDQEPNKCYLIVDSPVKDIAISDFTVTINDAEVADLVLDGNKIDIKPKLADEGQYTVSIEAKNPYYGKDKFTVVVVK